MAKLDVDLALVEKYSVPGPRYTSYPPATSFTESVGWKEVAEDILQTNQDGRDFSLYCHIPFCRSLCWYCGCNTIITTEQTQGDLYVGFLAKEISQISTVINPKRKLAQLYFGGGTPTFLTPGQIRKLGALLRSHFQFAKELEASVEIDPRRLTREHLAALREIGFSRVSLGVQDFDSKVQQAIHRVQPYEQTKMVTDWVRELGFKSLNLDLMYGLPYQTLDTFAATLEEALTFSPDRLAVFNYAHVPWLKPAQKILEQHLPAAETKLILLKTVIERLTLSGYVYVGMDHFALPTDSLVLAQRNRTLQRNFQGYSTCGGADIFGIGLSSISQTPGAYWQNQKESKPYYEALDAGRSPMAKGYILSEDDKIRRETIMRLMCDLSLDYGQMSSKLGVDFVEYFAGELESLNDFEKDGLLVKTHLGFMVTEIGRLFIRNIAMQFDRTLASKKEERRFSKTV